MANGSTVSKRVDFLINTSVEDLLSSLPHFQANNTEDVEVIRLGFMRCAKRGEKTKAAALHRKLKKMRKENGSDEKENREEAS